MIQSRLLIMLVSVSFASATVMGLLGYFNGRAALQQAALNQLVAIRAMRAHEVDSVFSSMITTAADGSANLSAREASTALNAGFAELNKQTPTAADQAKLTGFYDKLFLPALKTASGEDYVAATVMPTSNAGRLVQTYTTATFAMDWSKALATDKLAVDNSWTRARAQYHSYFERMVSSGGFDDAMLLNTSGDVVYSAFSGVDIGQNVDTGVLKDDPLAQAYRKVLRSASLDHVEVTDLYQYLPSQLKPTAWVLSAVGTDRHITGVLAVQLSLEQLNATMTGDDGWVAQGLGQTGEVYLAGPDKTMRSRSRVLIQNPGDYAAQVIENGTTAATAAQVVKLGRSELVQPVDTFAVNQALTGASGTAVVADYIGGESLVAYAPLTIDGVDWVIVARVTSAEAFAPVNEFARIMGLSLLGILLLVSLGSLLLAQAFTRPLKRLLDAVRRAAGGDLEAVAPVEGRGEYAELGEAFNDLTSGLRIKEDLIAAQNAENQKLLLSVMPAPVAARYRAGEENIAMEHSNVAVVFSEILGLEEADDSRTTEEQLELLNQLLRSFDEAADRIGIDKVRTLRDGYLVSSGLVTPRIDNARRAVEFAVEQRRIVERFNAQQGLSVSLRAGIDYGSVSSGLVGRTNLAFDLWGEAVNLARKVRTATGQPGIYLSQAVVDKVQDSIPVAEAGVVEGPRGSQPVWKVV